MLSSNTVNQQGHRLHRNFANSIFVVQIYQTNARTKVLVLQTCRNAIEEMPGEKRCLKLRYHIRLKVNIFVLLCALVMRIFRTERI